jgi:predicted ATP-grasp superfamily ATP-dependent carboligase
MLTAVAADFARIPGVSVATCCDSRIELDQSLRIECRTAASPAEERRLFRELAGACDAAFVIAPEFDSLLADRRRMLDEVGTRCLGGDAGAIDLCADKLRLAELLERHHLPTIPTRAWDPAHEPIADAYPLVLKPRDGAGSQDSFVIRSGEEWNVAVSLLRSNTASRAMIVQPYIAGDAVSVAVLMSPETSRLEVLPLATQRLSDDGRLRYLGGSVPAHCPAEQQIRELIRAACNSIPGLGGYVGVDLIIPHASARPPVIVEVNPRLTTSYLGYRRLTDENLAERLLFPERFPHAITWRRHVESFGADGKRLA